MDGWMDGMYVCMYVCTYVRTYVRMYVCMYVFFLKCVFSGERVCWHIGQGQLQAASGCSSRSGWSQVDAIRKSPPHSPPPDCFPMIQHGCLAALLFGLLKASLGWWPWLSAVLLPVRQVLLVLGATVVAGGLLAGHHGLEPVARSQVAPAAW